MLIDLISRIKFVKIVPGLETDSRIHHAKILFYRILNYIIFILIYLNK